MFRGHQLIDQGRMALIAKDDTEELSETPITPSAENRLYERREFYLAENGPGRVVEISRPQGAFESGFRASYIDPENKETRKKLTDYVKTEYLADKLTRFERTDPMNLSEAFQLTIEAAPAKRGFTDLGSGVAAIRRESLFYYLPTELQQAKEEESKEEAAEREKKKRTEDYQLGEAFLSEWEYVVVPPAGFKAKALPEKKSEAMNLHTRIFCG
jgi:phage-related minor tail protein